MHTMTIGAIGQLERYSADRRRRGLEDTADKLNAHAQGRQDATRELREYLTKNRRTKDLNRLVADLNRLWTRAHAATARLNEYNREHPLRSY